MTDVAHVCFVLPDDALTDENAAAKAWLCAEPGFDVLTTTLANLAVAPPKPSSIVWLHWDRVPDLPDAVRGVLDAHVRAGGGLLATLAAAGLPARLGWEEVPPNEASAGAWSDEPEDLAFARSFTVLPRVRGLQSCRGHPLFDGLGSGAYTWDPEEGERFVRYAYTGDRWPKQGRVIAVQRSYIAMSVDRRLAWEYMIGDGWALCIGGYLYFAARQTSHRPHLEWLTRNALKRVAPNGKRARLLGGAWRKPEPGVALDPKVPLPPELPGDAGAAFALGGDIHLEREPEDEEYTLAGTRALLTGKERVGPAEIWFHPVRAVSRWELSAGEGRPRATARRYRIAPGLIERGVEVNGRIIGERTTVAPDEPAILIELVPASEGPAHLIWTMESDLRLMWPYPASTAGRLSYSVEAGAVGLQSESGEWLGLRIEPAPAVLTVANVSDSERSRVRVRAELELAGPTRILLVGTQREERPPARVDPAGWTRRRGAERAVQREVQTRLEGGDPELAEAIEWAKWRLSTYRVQVPGLGTSLVAGYAISRRGPFFDGRPGFAWYFGRDSVWTALACLAVGQSDAAREVLEFLGRHQDITGKILHECTTSGVIHYDAADSTPLYLLLAARYLAATGDADTLRREWPRIRKAYEFCLSTDGDGDGLIENTGVGHGWVEFGPFGGHHVSLYLAGVWVGALQELEGAARALDEPEFADQLAYRSAAARASIELSLYDPIQGRYANGRRPDGSLDLSETVMTAVPLLLGAVRRERCERWLDRVAGDDFTAPWGVRMVPRSESDYRPDGYHTGSVWPLYSGWASLAEARAGREAAARLHWEQTARLYRAHALGAWPEVLHGEDSRRIGVTADQAWSTAMALLPWAADLSRFDA